MNLETGLKLLMKPGDIVMTWNRGVWHAGIIIEMVSEPGPFDYRVWKVFVKGQIKQYTDLSLEGIDESR